jgi:DNA polymerase-1
MDKKLFLLDAMALIYRAYYAFSKNPRVSSKGMNTSAVYGFATTLMELLKNEKPSHIAVAFDSRGPTFRHEQYPEYKAKRQEVPEDIITSIPYVKKLIEGFNIPVIALPGFEADDIIGTLAKKAELQGFEVYMVTPDKDFGQLVSDKVFMYKPSRFGGGYEKWGPKEVCEKFGIDHPEQLKDILGLWGDVSDNIPGVPGIGEKKAKVLIKEFGSIENLLQNLGKVKEKRSGVLLKSNPEMAITSKKLATIMLDAPVDLDVVAKKIKDPDFEALKPLFEELEFTTFAKRFFSQFASENEETPAKAIPATMQMDLFGQGGLLDQVPLEQKIETLQEGNNYKTIELESELENLLQAINKKKSFCFDTETDSLEHIEAKLVGIAFCLEPGTAYYLPFSENQKEVEKLVEMLKPVFEDPGIEKTGQNLKYDIGVLANYGIGVNGQLFDTMLAHYLLQPDMRHNMDVLARTYLDYSTLGIEEIIGKKGKTQKSMRSIPVDIVSAYACEDADVTLRLRNVFEPMLAEQELLELFFSLETPLAPVLAKMERNGVCIDEKALEALSLVLEEEIRKVEKEIFELAGTSFNIGSPKQLGDILFERLKIADNAKKTKTKQYSTNEEVLVKLSHMHPIVGKVLDYRSLAKLKSTYVDSLPKLVNKATGRIHTSYNQAVAATGRLSSNNPNLQNIPIRTDQGRLIRKAFVTQDPAYRMLAADYSQIELRIIASLSKDKAMMEAFFNNYDIHTATAAKVYDVEMEDVTKEMRRNAKTVNFGIVYGISAFGLSQRINIPRTEAARIINQYFEKYPGIKTYMDETIAFAKEHQFVKTMLGRRRYIKDINSANGMLRGYAERNAINAPVQGTAADMIKLAMISIYKEMQKLNLRSKMTMQVHDELVFEAHVDEIDVLKKIVEQKMKEALTLEVPVVIELNVGDNWLEAH